MIQKILSRLNYYDMNENVLDSFKHTHTHLCKVNHILNCAMIKKKKKKMKHRAQQQNEEQKRDLLISHNTYIQTYT